MQVFSQFFTNISTFMLFHSPFQVGCSSYHSSTKSWTISTTLLFPASLPCLASLQTFKCEQKLPLQHFMSPLRPHLSHVLAQLVSASCGAIMSILTITTKKNTS